MARYSYRGRRRKTRSRNQIYGFLVLLVVVAVIAFAFGPFGKNKDETTDSSSDIGTSQANRSGYEANMGSRSDSETSMTDSESMNKGLPVTTAVELELERESAEMTPEPNLPEVILAPDIEPSSEAAELINEATALINGKPSKIIEARDKLNAALRMPLNRQQRQFVKDQLSDLADQWLFSKRIFPDDELCESIQVKPGALLETIGKQYKVPWEILLGINQLRRPEHLRAGERIKVVKGPFHAKVYRSSFTMDLYLQDRTFVKSFRVGLGKIETETPTGLWRVRSNGKLEQPPWPDRVTGKTYYPEDPDYPLGSRWIGLEGIRGEAKGREGFGIHGTKDPDQIGTTGSRGCIRMYNGDVILVYDLLVPTLSTVEVVE